MLTYADVCVHSRFEHAVPLGIKHDDFVFVNPPDGSHFTCFTGTKVQILTLGTRCIADMLVQAGDEILVLAEDVDFTCFRYKSTNTDAAHALHRRHAGAGGRRDPSASRGR